MVESLMTQSMPSRALPSREDCWSEEATSTLVDAWGRRYLELNRGNLRQKDWQEVAEAVNALHGHTKKTRRTDVQCKNRIDTLKKKYKIEKTKIAESNGTLMSSWPFFSSLHELIGSNYNKLPKAASLGSNSNSMPLGSNSNSMPLGSSSNSPPMAVPLPYRKLPLTLPLPPAPVATPLQIKLPAVILPPKRFSATEDSSFRRNYSVVAAAAAAKPVVEEEGEESSEEMENDAASEETGAEEEGMRRLAKAIERFGQIYERVEEMKQRQVVELEKQRMQFSKDLEVQRMQLFMDTQVQLEKIKQAKRSRSNDSYS